MYASTMIAGGSRSSLACLYADYLILANGMCVRIKSVFSQSGAALIRSSLCDKHKNIGTLSIGGRNKRPTQSFPRIRQLNSFHFSNLCVRRAESVLVPTHIRRQTWCYSQLSSLAFSSNFVTEMEIALFFCENSEVDAYTDRKVSELEYAGDVALPSEYLSEFQFFLDHLDDSVGGFGARFATLKYEMSLDLTVSKLNLVLPVGKGEIG